MPSCIELACFHSPTWEEPSSELPCFLVLLRDKRMGWVYQCRTHSGVAGGFFCCSIMLSKVEMLMENVDDVDTQPWTACVCSLRWEVESNWPFAKPLPCTTVQSQLSNHNYTVQGCQALDFSTCWRLVRVILHILRVWEMASFFEPFHNQKCKEWIKLCFSAQAN